MRFIRKKMVNWYDPKQLAFTAVKTVISGIFGNFADRREMQAALDPGVEYFDYSDRPELWVDFISDLGDGFNSTYTLAHLMAQEQLDLDGHLLKRGNILIMGGDQVYPTPELKEYNNRLKGPYNAAFPWIDGDKDRPSLFALPGNHDWYDGLTNFLRLFCQGRSLGNWHSKQRRSYFALKLHHDYWLWGIDVQLNADIDYPQLCYFKEIAEEHIKEGDKIILCVAEPSWVYKSFDKKNSSHDRIQFFIEQIVYGKGSKFEAKNENVQVSAILTGDLHHYSRYEETHKNRQTRQLITAGGGGAFMHPTHTLKKAINTAEGSVARLKNIFPPKAASRRLGLHNIIFPFYSGTMVLFFGLLHLFTSWLLQVGSLGKIPFLETLSAYSLAEGQLPEIVTLIINTIATQPSVLGLNLLLFLGILMFTDTSSGKGRWNYIVGAIHGLLHLVNLYFLTWLFSRLNLHHWEMSVGSWDHVLLFSGEMILVGGITSAVIFGIYLLFSISLLDNHITEASSSFRWEGYKNFLRIHVTQKGITIYPVGVEKVVTNWKNIGTTEKPKFEGDAIDCSLIEDPIEIFHKP